jgi:hypothetical protein
MNTVNLIKALRYTIANDATVMGYLGKSTAADALTRLGIKHGFYMQKDGQYTLPAIAILVNDDEDREFIPVSELFVKFTIVNKFENPDAMMKCIQMKDRLKDLLCNKKNDDTKHESINTQASTLGFTLKVRDSRWVSGITYDDQEQGSQRLHKIDCVIKMVVGD